MTGVATADHIHTVFVQDVPYSKNIRMYCTLNGVRHSVGAPESCFDNELRNLFFATIK